MNALVESRPHVQTSSRATPAPAQCFQSRLEPTCPMCALDTHAHMQVQFFSRARLVYPAAGVSPGQVLLRGGAGSWRSHPAGFTHRALWNRGRRWLVTPAPGTRPGQLHVADQPTCVLEWPHAASRLRDGTRSPCRWQVVIRHTAAFPHAPELAGCNADMQLACVQWREGLAA